jgi:hypothetical protein
MNTPLCYGIKPRESFRFYPVGYGGYLLISLGSGNVPRLSQRMCLIYGSLNDQSYLIESFIRKMVVSQQYIAGFCHEDARPRSNTKVVCYYYLKIRSRH